MAGGDLEGSGFQYSRLVEEGEPEPWKAFRDMTEVVVGEESRSFEIDHIEGHVLHRSQPSFEDVPIGCQAE